MIERTPEQRAEIKKKVLDFVSRMEDEYKLDMMVLSVYDDKYITVTGAGCPGCLADNMLTWIAERNPRHAESTGLGEMDLEKE